MGAAAAAAVEQTCDALGQALAVVRAEVARLGSVLGEADAGGTQAILGQFDALSRVAGAGWALAAGRGAALEAHTAFGHRSAGDWLAHMGGISFSRAKEALALTEQLPRAPAVQDAFLRGDLSMSQAQTIVDAVSHVPTCAEELLALTQTGSHQELCQRVVRLKQSARSREDERHRSARAHRRRSLRWVQLPDGGVRVQLYLTDEAWGRCLPQLDARADVLFRQARSAQAHATRDQYLADACVDLLSGKFGGAGQGRSTVTTVVRVDAAALRRGHVEPGEVCEIAGVGPVSAELARELLGEGFVRLLVTDGADVTTITGRTRVRPARLEAAVRERDLTCVVPGCGVTIGLQTHHWQTDVQFGGPTVLENLCRICSVHHGLATHGGWRLLGGPGAWRWEPPDWPVSPGLQKQRRKLAAHRRGLPAP
jgi:hypothetical protein